jgi:cytochrome c nitrite reductase small subunit
VTALHRVLAAFCGILIGVGAFTLHYGEGLSYFSTDPAACMNCHIMTPQFNSWQKASHHTAAACVDCHLPHDFIGKYMAKAENGWNHSKAFTTQNFREPIQINAKNSAILQANCLACHSKFVDDLVHSNTSDLGAVRCIHCHRSVGHGEKTGLGGPVSDSEKE